MTQETTVQDNEIERIEDPTAQPIPTRILVALDSSPHSQAALRAGARLAALLQAELHGIFIEDDRLLRLCNSPFSREISVLTATVRPLESPSMQRSLRVMAAELRQQLAYAAAETQVHWAFHVRRGAIEQELLHEAKDVLMLTLGRANRFTRGRMGTTARHLAGQALRPLLLLEQKQELRDTLTLVYTGSASSQRALQLAAQLSALVAHPLTVLLVTTDDRADDLSGEVRQVLATQTEPPRIHLINSEQQLTDAIDRAIDTLILPTDYIERLPEINSPVILVP